MSSQASSRSSSVVPAQSGGTVHVPQGSCVVVTDLEGKQVADFWALVLPEGANGADGEVQAIDWLCASQTRNWAEKLFPAVGDRFYSYRARPLLELVADSSPGPHDMLYPPCDPPLYESDGKPGHPNCHENFLGAVAAAGVRVPVVPQPVNFFQNSLPDGRWGLDVYEARSRPGDSVTLRALEDVLVVVTACSVDTYETNGWKCTPIELAVVPAEQ
jgi:uncharacterized protein